MKRIITGTTLMILAFTSCQKEELKTQNTCSCYETHESIKPKVQSNGLVQATWSFDYNTNPQPDLCEKATGEWVYSGNPTSQRYKVICN